MKKILFLSSILAITFMCSCSTEDPVAEDLLNDTSKLPPLAESTCEATSNFVSLIDVDNFVTQNNLDPSTSRASEYVVTPVYDSNNILCMYVINYNKGGWVILSATRKFKPILAFSDSGMFDTNALQPEGLEIWKHNMFETISNVEKLYPADSIQEYQSQWERISPKSLSKGNKVSDNGISTRQFSNNSIQSYYSLRQIMSDSIAFWRSKGYTVETFENLASGQLIPGAYGEQGYTIDDIKMMCDGMMNPNYIDYFSDLSCAVYRHEYIDEKTPTLIQTTWEQKNGYNCTFPNDNPVGCCALAVGQIMRYFRHPSNFDWDNMPLHTPTTTTSDFLYTIAQDLNSVFSIKNTSAQFYDIKRVLGKYFYFYDNDTEDHNKYAPKNPQNYDATPIVLYAGWWKNLVSGHAWLGSGTCHSFERIRNDIYTFIELDKMSSCGNMAQINETTGCDYSYMIWGFSPNINGYYLTSYEGLPTYNNPGERYKTLYLTGFSKR